MRRIILYICLLVLNSWLIYAFISDWSNAIDLIGQYSNTSSFTPAYTAARINNGPSDIGIWLPETDMVMDTSWHRLFVGDTDNSRVLVFDLNTSNQLIDKIADHVLGQSNMYTKVVAATQAGMGRPLSLAYDSANNRLFVADQNNNRVLVYDVASITDGENAINVLGQTTFTGSGLANTQSGLNVPIGLLYDAANNRLFVSESTGNRVKVFDVASITNGENAIDLIGQYSSVATLTPIYTTKRLNNVPNDSSISGPIGNSVIDTAWHRLFLSDSDNNRILVFDLNASNQLVDKVPDHVLGQSNMYTNSAVSSQSGLVAPESLAYDAINNRLFVAEFSGYRVKVFDVASITDGENAINILGQSNFTSSALVNSQAGTEAPAGLAYDAANSRLFVSESSYARVKVFDVASITNGENAINVLGQTTFTATGVANTQSGLNYPKGLAYDATNNRLFVSESAGNRVKVFDVASITDGEDAINVLGQTNFTGSTSGNTQSKLNSPIAVDFDTTNNRLFVAEASGNRVKVFDVASITNGENAINVLGQSTFTGASGANTQNWLFSPQGLCYDATNSRLYVSEYGWHRVKIFDVEPLDVVAPIISQTTAVSTPTRDTTPNYTFTSNEAGTISYGGSCTSSTTSALASTNTITFSELSAWTYSNCTITVTDASGNASNTLNVTAFVIDLTAPTNQDTVFPTSVSKQGGDSVTVVSSWDATNVLWFAPDNTTSFTAWATMTTAGGTATSILAPANAGTYKLYVLDAAGNISSPSTASLTVDNSGPTNQDTVFPTSVSKQGGDSVTVVSSWDATNVLWFAPDNTTSFTAWATMTTAGGTATSILAPANAGTYKLYVLDAAGNISSPSTAELTVSLPETVAFYDWEMVPFSWIPKTHPEADNVMKFDSAPELVDPEDAMKYRSNIEYINDLLKNILENDSSPIYVIALQEFLNDKEAEKLILTGKFDIPTQNAALRFQKKYIWDNLLAPTLLPKQEGFLVDMQKTVILWINQLTEKFNNIVSSVITKTDEKVDIKEKISHKKIIVNTLKRWGKNNFDDVMVLQKFLNEHEGERLILNGKFDILTQKAVKRFQKKYSAEILAPFGLKVPTGVVGTKTLQKINALIAE